MIVAPSCSLCGILTHRPHDSFVYFVLSVVTNHQVLFLHYRQVDLPPNKYISQAMRKYIYLLVSRYLHLLFYYSRFTCFNICTAHFFCIAALHFYTIAFLYVFSLQAYIRFLSLQKLNVRANRLTAAFTSM